MARILAGKEPFIYDPNILKEKYQHYTPWVDFEIISNEGARRTMTLRTNQSIPSNPIHIEDDLSWTKMN